MAVTAKLLWILLLSVVCIDCHSIWYDVSVDANTCQKPCMDTKQCIADLECGEDKVVYDAATVCGCCPGCVEPKANGEECELGGIPCMKNFECKKNETTSNFICQEAEVQCPKDSGTTSWTPACDSDGTYSAVQIKGNDRAFCTDPFGNRTFGFQWIENAENITCACSRYVYQLRTTRKDVSIHCTEGGDFEELQCDDHLCWCAEPSTGQPQTRVVPETMMKLLPCYDESKVGSQYLRQCESFAVAKARIEEAFKRHGTITPNLDYINCDYDGSYGFKQTDGTTCYCAWKDGSRIGSWATEARLMNQVNCYCARDSKYKDIDGKGREKLICLPNGNYQPYQEDNGTTKICVDQDGYVTNRTVSSAVKCPGEQ